MTTELLCHCGTFTLGESRARLSGNFVHTPIGCPNLPIVVDLEGTPEVAAFGDAMLEARSEMSLAVWHKIFGAGNIACAALIGRAERSARKE